MKKQIIFLLFSIYFLTFSFEVGPTISQNLSSSTGDIGYGVSFTVGTGSPTYVWRQYGEDVPFILNEVILMDLTDPRGNEHTRVEVDNGALAVSAPSGMNITLKNETLRGIEGPGFQELTLRKSSETSLGATLILADTPRRVNQTARFSGDLVVDIPWNVPDGTYTLSTIFSGQIKVFFRAGTWGFVNITKRSPNSNFDLITYLQLNIPTEMNFGRVVFMSGVKPIKKMGIIKILGGQGQNINVTLSESKLFMRRVGGNETVPLFLSLTDGHTESITEINTSLDNSGRKNLQFEARIEPGLYPDVPEGKYSGIARFQVKYN